MGQSLKSLHGRQIWRPYLPLVISTWWWPQGFAKGTPPPPKRNLASLERLFQQEGHHLSLPRVPTPTYPSPVPASSGTGAAEQTGGVRIPTQLGPDLGPGLPGLDVGLGAGLLRIVQVLLVR